MLELKDYDWQALSEAVKKGYPSVKIGDRATIQGAIDSLRHLPFPPGYLEWMLLETLDILSESDSTAWDVTSVYLAFFGADIRASHLKIGVARNVKHRVASLKTGNPMPNLWTFAAELPSRRKAMAIEGALLRHMREDRAEGEWVNVYGLSEQATGEVVKSLGEVATAANKVGPVVFRLIEV